MAASWKNKVDGHKEECKYLQVHGTYIWCEVTEKSVDHLYERIDKHGFVVLNGYHVLLYDRDPSNLILFDSVTNANLVELQLEDGMFLTEEAFADKL
jgi:hypothetical protein